MATIAQASFCSGQTDPDRDHAEGAARSGRVMILMRGLPSCGKSHTGRKLASAGGTVLEFDQYFHTEVGEDPSRFDWSDRLLPDARRSFIDRVMRAVDAGITPIVVDNDNTPHPSTKTYVAHAVKRGYAIEFEEPQSPWWRAVRALLRDKHANRTALEAWARRLAGMSRGTHRVPLTDFLHGIEHWKDDLTVADILNVEE